MSQTLILGLLILLGLALVVVPLVRRFGVRQAPPAVVAKPPPKPADTEGGNPPRSQPGHMVGQVRGESRKAVGDIIDRHPGAAVSVLRRWIRPDDTSS